MTALLNAEIDRSLREAPALRPLYDRLAAVQLKIDQRKAKLRELNRRRMPIPAADSPPPTKRSAAMGESERVMRHPRARSRSRRNVALGLAFLAPNILGFLAFTAIPLAVSLVMAFTNWDLKLHNQYRAAEQLALGQPAEPIQFVGLENFRQLFDMPDFWRYLGNTLFLMLAMPFSIAASLGAAILLSKDLRGGTKRVWFALVTGAVLVAAVVVLLSVGASGAGMVVVVGGLIGIILVSGATGGTTVYRTLFYLPNFTASVATFLLWKKLYNPTNGPITNALSPALATLGGVVNGSPAAAWQFGLCVLLGLMLLTLWAATRRVRALWVEGDLGWASALLAVVLLALPTWLAWTWLDPPAFPAGVRFALVVLAAGVLVVSFVSATRAARTFTTGASSGMGTALMLAFAALTAQLVLLALAAIAWQLPAWAAYEGLQPPAWLADLHWAKPSIMIMGFWAAIGSNTMLLYLAALSGVPPELYEAADIDGAGRFTRFWHVTWPQLAPTTFFVVVMGVIGGLQGGFEMARVMTLGGPAGQTTTLSYFIYIQGFEAGRLGFSSAIAWLLFLMVLIVTLVNWKVGSRFVND